ncbi:aminoacyl-histidine dipeptidase [Candidatus Symbiothrix dinenymphae]|uniref:aminoacyl-histidine dipeptidase n=1 Tax=Candidatus Symbiothrix dinenymphae TaxID=467085 RepID=UPI0006C211FA|nr:aminoacyl-histidine dipeptidase [Candidatus Symbiothrix dinenymphae]GAP73296.1 aminoacyl-histidine dipeptidase [Candidatus Symbiothrix dinenymphae]
MENPILGLKPANVWKHFYALTQIPRPSGHKQPVASFVETFGKSLKLETLRDAEDNICIRKPATKGYENRQPVILQAHLDMVPQANSDVKFDFTKDAIQPYIDGEWVKAKGTTLGADNGIGAAAIMAVLEATDIEHGPIEGLFTSDEETGMFGANGIKPDFLKGKILLNLDTEDYDELIIGCAGGVDITATFTYYEKMNEPKGEKIALRVSLTGLKGGHSGVDIHLGRANAIQLMFTFLKAAMTCDTAFLSSVNAGTLRNAIPREAFATLVVEDEETYELIATMVKNFEKIFNEDFKDIEDKISFKVEKIPFDNFTLLPWSVERGLIGALVGCPNNVINRFALMPELVETSINLAIVNVGNGEVEVKFLARSASESKKGGICNQIDSLFSMAQADTCNFSGSYPGWSPNANSPVLKTMETIFEQQRGKKPHVTVVHAGLECGIIMSHVPTITDAVSFGPTIKFPHSPDEKVEIATVQKFWDFLTAVLKQAPV